jgi:hypothetical protein
LIGNGNTRVSETAPLRLDCQTANSIITGLRIARARGANALFVMAGLVPAIHDFVSKEGKTWTTGRRRAEATPFFERLCPVMTVETHLRVLAA